MIIYLPFLLKYIYLSTHTQQTSTTNSSVNKKQSLNNTFSAMMFQKPDPAKAMNYSPLEVSASLPTSKYTIKNTFLTQAVETTNYPELKVRKATPILLLDSPLFPFPKSDPVDKTLVIDASQLNNFSTLTPETKVHTFPNHTPIETSINTFPNPAHDMKLDTFQIPTPEAMQQNSSPNHKNEKLKPSAEPSSPTRTSPPSSPRIPPGFPKIIQHNVVSSDELMKFLDENPIEKKIDLATIVQEAFKPLLTKFDAFDEQLDKMIKKNYWWGSLPHKWLTDVLIKL